MADPHRAGHCVVDMNLEDPLLEDKDADFDDEDEDDGISQPEVTCLCCYDVLLDPTTLNCGHSFCRHCLALWLQSSRKAECPTCRKVWQGIPKVNISFRDLLEKNFQADVLRRRQSIMNDLRIAQALLVFQQAERVLDCRAARPRVRWQLQLGTGGFLWGVFITLSFVAMVFLVCYWSGSEGKVELLVKKPLGVWTVEEVGIWMGNLGTWASPYRDLFLKEKVNGRLLNVLGEKDLSQPPYEIMNELHRRAVLREVHTVQELGFKRPQTLWEYKAVNEGKSLFFLYAMTDTPRLTILYIYFFDYHDSFLPFMHVTCPSAQQTGSEDELSFRNLDPPNWKQWFQFGVKFLLLPYQLISDFAWDWMSVHYWMSRIIMWHALMLTLREGDLIWRLRSYINCRRLLEMIAHHVGTMFLVFFCSLIFWKLLPQFVLNCTFYWGLYFLPFTTTFALLGPYLRLLYPHIRNQQ